MSERFRKKPVVVEAVQWNGANTGDIEAFMGLAPGELEAGGFALGNPWLMIPTLESPHEARRGDWIIRGVQGEFYPCKPDIFAETYEAVRDAD